MHRHVRALTHTCTNPNNGSRSFLHKTHGAQNGGRILHNGTDRSVPTDTMSSFSAWLNTVEGNKEKQEKNTINEARRKGTVDELLRADKAKKMKLVSNLIDKAAVPLKAMKDYSDVSQTLAGMVAVVVHRSEADDEKKRRTCLSPTSTPIERYM